MENSLNEYLLDGEYIRWSGRPAPFSLLNSAGRTDMLLTWALSILLLIISFAAIFPKSTPSSFPESLLVLLVVGFLPMLMSLRPIWDKQLLERRTFYAITNYRVIALVRDELMYIPLSSMLQVEIESQDPEHGVVRFSSNLDWDFGSTLANAVSGIPSDGSRCHMKGMLFYHIPHPDALLQYFS